MDTEQNFNKRHHYQMNYKKFTIKNFRSFEDEQRIELAQPLPSKIGSGITYLVGLNNTGKTTIIEAMWLKKDDHLNDSEKKSLPPEFNLYSDDANIQRSVRLSKPESYTFIEQPDRDANDRTELFEIISSRRTWDATANGSDTAANILANSAIGGNPRNKQEIATALILKDIEKDQTRYDSFTALVQRVIPEFTKWVVAHENQPYIQYISSNGIRHRTDFLGDGVISAIRIIAHLFENRNTGLIIDEPELSLHPQAQKNLLEIIAEFSEKRQVLIATHSPYFINWEYITNGAKLNRIAKIDDIKSEIFTLGDPSKYSGLISGANWQQPYLIDEVAKEIFFAVDNILFLEGQEDVGLLRNEFDEKTIHIFGYGVRGCDNFKLALSMAKDLGFKKVGVLIDKGSKEDSIFKELEKDYPNYKIIQWNKNDIRDKKLTQLQKKEGYFNESGEKKSADKLDDFNEKIQTIKEFFAN